jgi:hypothetical protein
LHFFQVWCLDRVGRFGDSCTRTLFADVPFVDNRVSLLNRGKMLRFLTSVDKKKVYVKQIKVKELITKVSKNLGAKN